MGIATGTALLISAALTAAGTAASMMFTPTAPQVDNTDYDMLRKTQEAADVEAADAQSRIEEARKREELRQQMLGSNNVKTSDTGASNLGYETIEKVAIEEDVYNEYG